MRFKIVIFNLFCGDNTNDSGLFSLFSLLLVAILSEPDQMPKKEKIELNEK